MITMTSAETIVGGRFCGTNLTATSAAQSALTLPGGDAKGASGQHAGRESVPSNSRPAYSSTENAGLPDAGYASSAGSVVASQVRPSSKAPAGSAHASP